MSQYTYTAIPDTSDAVYWERKDQNTLERSSTFVPRDKDLHRQLKEKARAERIPKRPYREWYKG